VLHANVTVSDCTLAYRTRAASHVSRHCYVCNIVQDTKHCSYNTYFADDGVAVALWCDESSALLLPTLSASLSVSLRVLISVFRRFTISLGRLDFTARLPIAVDDGLSIRCNTYSKINAIVINCRCYQIV
jgi:hypothetical protein